MAKLAVSELCKLSTDRHIISRGDYFGNITSHVNIHDTCYCRATARRVISCYVSRASFKQQKWPSKSFKGIGNSAIR